MARLDERIEGMTRLAQAAQVEAKRSSSPGKLNMAAVHIRAMLLLSLAMASIASAAEMLPASGTLDCDDTRRTACEFVDPASGLRVRLPHDWPMRRLRISTETGPSAGVRQPFAERWVAIDYVPEEPALPEVSLFHAAVLPRGAWLSLAGSRGVTPGTEVAASQSRAVVAARESEHPYPPGSRDAQIFEALMPSLEEISLILTLPPAP